MASKSKKRKWPYVLLLLVLLVASFAAPQRWLGGFRWPLYDDAERAKFSARMFGDDAHLVSDDRLHGPHPVAGRDSKLRLKQSGELNVPPRPSVGEESIEQVEEQLVAWEDLTKAGIETHLETNASSTGEVIYGPLVASRYDANGANVEVLPPPISAFSRPLDEIRLARTPLHLANVGLLVNGGVQPRAITVWPRPTSLIEQLERIEGDQRSQKWAQQTLDALDELSDVEALDGDASRKLLVRLTQLAMEVDSFALAIPAIELQAEVRSAASALQRRVRVWQQVHAMLAGGSRDQFVSTLATSEIRRQIDAAMRSIPGEKAPPAWRKYLGLDELRATMDDAAAADDRIDMARLTLERIHAETLNARQRTVVGTPAFAALDASLRQLATEPVEALEMLYVVEQFEATQSLPDARQLALVAARHRFSTDASAAELVRRIDASYRAPNVRTAISSELFNRLLPQPKPKTDAVGEQILSAWVEGKRTTKANLSVNLIPDDDQWRMGMEAAGTTTSDTTSYSGNAALYTQGEGNFTARKLIVVDHHAIHVWPAEADATFENWLYGAGTSYDSVPLVGRIARNSAVEQFGANQWAAQQEVAARMEKRAAKMLDREAHRPLIDAEGQFEKRLLVPLTGAAVEPAAMKMFTTKERVVGYYRLASVGQLGGHSSRPWAPRGSLLSMQLHESAFNNVIAGLRLDGREDDLENVYREIWKVFGVERNEMPESMPEKVRVHFADEEAVRIRLAEGHMEVIIKLKELETERRTWRDLVVRNFYAPDPSTRRAVLVRDSSVRLVGERLGVRDQIALRGIFSKIFAGNSEFPLLGERLANNPGVADLEVTQYVISDGWIGLALGPKPNGGATTVDREARRRTNLQSVRD